MKNEKPVHLELEFYVNLLHAMSKDMANYTCAVSAKEVERDMEEISRRVDESGLDFLTKALPSLGKVVDRALSNGSKLDAEGFEKIPGTQIPRLFGGFFKLIFDADGYERSDASVWSISALRQLCFLFYKLQVPYTPEQNENVINRFITTDEEVGKNQLSSLPNSTEWILRYAKNCIHAVLGYVDPISQIAPRHGPGAVATGEKGCCKGMFKRFYTSINEVFPYEEHFFYNLSHFCDELESFKAMKELDHGTAKVVLVPKDSRGPRLISCEPLELQWIQQGLLNKMVPQIERSPFTRGLVNFGDQTINQRLALESSKDGTRVTLDMKDASDRVSLRLVERLFPARWVDALKACRSTATRLPDGRVLNLNKFAPMGSAVCFPVEALVFWALATASIVHKRNLSGLRLAQACRTCEVYVYGDDIICNLEDHEIVMSVLESVGLLFNRDKCCVGGSFRESCGVDAYNGVDVTPLKIRARWDHRLLGMTYPSYVAYHNWLCSRGYEISAAYLETKIQQVRPTPYSDKETGVVSLINPREMAVRLNHDMGFEMRFNKRTHLLEVAGWAVHSRPKEAVVPGWGEMLRIHAQRRLLPSQDGTNKMGLNPFLPLAPELVDVPQMRELLLASVDPLTMVRAYQYTLPRRVTLKRGWGTIS